MLAETFACVSATPLGDEVDPEDRLGDRVDAGRGHADRGGNVRDRHALGDVLGAERRVADNVGEDVDGEREMLVEDLDVIARVFLGGERVELAADRVDRLGDVLGRPRAGAFEQHVLDEVRDAAALGRFVARPARQPHSNTDRADLRHPLREDAKSVIENVSDDRGVWHWLSVATY